MHQARSGGKYCSISTRTVVDVLGYRLARLGLVGWIALGSAVRLGIDRLTGACELMDQSGNFSKSFFIGKS